MFPRRLKLSTEPTGADVSDAATEQELKILLVILFTDSKNQLFPHITTTTTTTTTLN